jgi:hypothetical protein
MKKQILISVLFVFAGYRVMQAQSQKLACQQFTFPLGTVFSTDLVYLFDTLYIDKTVNGYHYLQLDRTENKAIIPRASDNMSNHFHLTHTYYSNNHSLELAGVIPFTLCFNGRYADKKIETINDTLSVSYYQDNNQKMPIYINMQRNTAQKRLNLRFVKQKVLQKDSLNLLFELQNNSSDTVFIETTMTVFNKLAPYNRYNYLGLLHYIKLYV